MVQLKAIETEYNGYKFRSRLEARWAVFFDAMGIKYEYEPEGYDLGEAGWYLPDFFIRHKEPYGDFFVEIKAICEHNEKCEALAEKGDVPVILLAGTPKEYICLLYASEDLRYRIIDESERFISMAYTYGLTVDVRFFTCMLFPFKKWAEMINNITIPLCQDDLRLFPDAAGKTTDAAKEIVFKKICRKLVMFPMQKATDVAMQARFEHKASVGD